MCVCVRLLGLLCNPGRWLMQSCQGVRQQIQLHTHIVSAYQLRQQAQTDDTCTYYRLYPLRARVTTGCLLSSLLCICAMFLIKLKCLATSLRTLNSHSAPHRKLLVFLLCSGMSVLPASRGLLCKQQQHSIVQGEESRRGLANELHFLICLLKKFKFN